MPVVRFGCEITLRYRKTTGAFKSGRKLPYQKLSLDLTDIACGFVHAKKNLPTSSRGSYALPSQVSLHHFSMRAQIWSRILRTPLSRSSSLPISAAGSGKLQCNRVET